MAGAAHARSMEPENRLSPVAGMRVPALDLAVLHGGRIDAHTRRGRVVLVHFFATWCETCRPELDSLDRLAREDGARGLEVLAVSVAEVEGRLTRYFAGRPASFPILLDCDRAAARAWGIDALPSTVVLGRDGRPRLAVRGDLDWRRADIRAALDILLAEEDGPAGPMKTGER